MRLTHNSSALLTVPTRPSRRFQAGPILSKSLAMGLLRAYKAPWSSARSPPNDCVLAAIAARTALHEASSARGKATTVLKPRGGSAPASRQAFSCCGSVTTSPRGDLAWAGAGGAAFSSSSRFMAQRRQGRALLGWRAGLPGIRAARAHATEACRSYAGLALRAAPERLGSYRGLQALRSRSLGVDLKLAVGRLAGEQRDQEQPPMPPQSPKNTKRAAVDTSVL